MSVQNAFEDRLRSLAARGFGVSVNLNTAEYGTDRGKQVFVVCLRKGGVYSADLEARGRGLSLDQAAEAALRAAEAYLSAVEPIQAVEGALLDVATKLLPA